MARKGNRRGNTGVTAVTRPGEPTKQRLGKGDLAPETLADPDSPQGRFTRFRARDTVTILASHGLLSERDVIAAKVVRQWAHDGALQAVSAQDLMSSGGGAPQGRVPLTDRQLDARRSLAYLLERLGGTRTVGGSLFVRVLCEEQSLAGWEGEQAPVGGRRALSAKHGAGALIVVLDVVAGELDRTGRWGVFAKEFGQPV